MTLSKPKVVLACLLALVCAGMLGRYLQRVPKRHYCDFRVYHHTARVFLDRKDIYADYDEQGITPFKYSPFFAFLVSPLGLLPIKGAAGVFFVVNFLATIALFALSLKLCSERRLSARQGFLVCFLAALLVLRFIVQVWDSGQVPIIIGCLVLASLYFFSRGKEFAGAAFLSAAILFKYLPAIFIPYFLVRRRFKAAGLTLLFCAVWLLVPALYAGLAKDIGYLGSWLPSIARTSLDQGSYLDFKSQSFLSMILRMTTPSVCAMNLLSLGFGAALKLAYALAFGLYLLALIPVRGRDTARLDYALLFTFIPLFNPNGWMVNFAALAFPCAVLAAYLISARRRDGFVLTCLAASFVFTSFPNQELVGNALENFFDTCSTVTVGALFLVAALVKLKFSPQPVRS